MARIYLTDVVVGRLKRPAKGRNEIADVEPGLFLWATANGLKSWTVVYRLPVPGTRQTIRRKKVVGHFPTMGVVAARDRARELMAMAANGVDPELKEAEQQEAEQRATAEREAGSFRTVAEAFVAAMEAGKLTGGRRRPVAATTATGRASLLRRLVLPVLGDDPLHEVSAAKVARLLAKLEKDEGPVDETLKVIRGVFKFAVSRGLFHGPLPTDGMTNRQPPKKETRALDDAELRAIWHAAGRHGWPFGSIIRLLMLTGQRKMEIAALHWDEFDEERRLLVIPAGRVKNRAGAHEVPLSEPAMQIMRQARAAYEALGYKSGLVFPCDTGLKPISGWNRLKPSLNRVITADIVGLSDAERRAIRAGGALRQDTWDLKRQALAKLEGKGPRPWRIHDLRHTFITRCRDGDENAEGEIVWSAPIDVLQATVNHEITVGVTGRYDHGDIQKRYRLRKRELLDWWAGKLMQIV
jgi:integrase